MYEYKKDSNGCIPRKGIFCVVSRVCGSVSVCVYSEVLRGSGASKALLFVISGYAAPCLSGAAKVNLRVSYVYVLMVWLLRVEFCQFFL